MPGVDETELFLELGLELAFLAILYNMLGRG